MSKVIKAMKPMLAEARASGKWLYTHYQNLWFTPDELEAEMAAGRFRWGPVNWILRDPQERLAELDRAGQTATAAYELVRRKIEGASP